MTATTSFDREEQDDILANADTRSPEQVTIDRIEQMIERLRTIQQTVAGKDVWAGTSFAGMCDVPSKAKQAESLRNVAYELQMIAEATL
jgi:hypothetical protein